MQARHKKPPCNLVHVGQNLTINGSCVTGSVVSASSSCQRVFVTPLSRGPAGRSPVVIPQSSAQPRAVLQPPQYISCSQPPPSLVPRLLVGGKKRAWYPLFAHVLNYPLLSMCSGNSGRGTRNTYPRDL